MERAEDEWGTLKLIYYDESGCRARLDAVRAG